MPEQPDILTTEQVPDIFTAEEIERLEIRCSPGSSVSCGEFTKPIRKFLSERKLLRKLLAASKAEAERQLWLKGKMEEAHQAVLAARDKTIAGLETWQRTVCELLSPEGDSVGPGDAHDVVSCLRDTLDTMESRLAEVESAAKELLIVIDREPGVCIAAEKLRTLLAISSPPKPPRTEAGVESKCPRCRGEGALIAINGGSRECPKCKGTGFVAAKPVEVEAKAGEERKLDRIFDQLDDLLLAGKFSECDAALAAMDVEWMTNAQLLTALTATAAAAVSLPSRSLFASRTRDELKSRGVDAEKLMQGLDPLPPTPASGEKPDWDWVETVRDALQAAYDLTGEIKALRGLGANEYHAEIEGGEDESGVTAGEYKKHADHLELRVDRVHDWLRAALAGKLPADPPPAATGWVRVKDVDGSYFRMPSPAAGQASADDAGKAGQS